MFKTFTLARKKSLSYELITVLLITTGPVKLYVITYVQLYSTYTLALFASIVISLLVYNRKKIEITNIHSELNAEVIITGIVELCIHEKLYKIELPSPLLLYNIRQGRSGSTQNGYSSIIFNELLDI